MLTRGEAHCDPTGAASAAGAQSDEIDDVLALRGEAFTEEWDSQRFRFISLLQEAPRNNGRVELCEDMQTSGMVAVKAMPISWACASHEAFMVAHPEDNELPWRDIGATRYLCRSGLRCVCTFVGCYLRHSEEHGQEICLVLSYCAGGDLFSWLERGLPAGRAREHAARPLMRKVLEAVRDVQAQGVAHGDISLENVLLHKEARHPDEADVRLIDFGGCTGARAVGLRGKPSYQAPEVHLEEEYDALAADAFSLGVMIFTLAVGNYPWRSTRPLACPCFKFAAERGLPAYLARRKIRCEEAGEIVTLAELLSPELVSLLSGLLAVDAAARPSVARALEHPWFTAPRAPPAPAELPQQGTELRLARPP